jgi:hypothetical protein
MATLEELTVIATQQVEDAKPLFGQDANGVKEFTETEYQQAIIDRANSMWNDQQFGYIQARQDAYGSIADQLDMMYWDSVNGTTVWADHIAKVKSDNPKPA